MRARRGFFRLVALGILLTGAVYSTQKSSAQQYAGAFVPVSQVDQAMPGQAASVTEARLAAEIASLSARRQVTKERLEARSRSLYRLTRSGMLPLSGGFEALLGHVSRINRLKRMVKSDLSLEVSLRRRVAALESQRSVAQGDAQFRGERRGQAQAQEQAQARVHQRFEQAWADTRGGQASAHNTLNGYGSLRLVDEAETGGARFIASRGHLLSPVLGSSDVREGRREDGLGLEFVSPAGTGVRAVADGRVAFAEHYASYGSMVILDHGGSYFTVYAGLGQVYARSGDVLASGARIGTVGPEGTDRGLYFEVRRGTRSLDAPSWLGL